MPHLIDTSALQHFLHPQAKQKWPLLVARIAEIIEGDGTLNLCAMTAFEIRRGLRVLALRGEGRDKQLRAELLLRRSLILGLGAAWTGATDIFASGAMHKPAIKLSDGDLLIAACAFAQGYTLVTSDKRLGKNLALLGYERHVEILELI